MASTGVNGRAHMPNSGLRNIAMKVLAILLFLSNTSKTKADPLQSFTVCIRFMISHFDENGVLALESRDKLICVFAFS